jgi:hypothetical protein
LLVVTEKDDVKLSGFLPRYVLRVDLQFDVAPSPEQLGLG